MNVPRQYLYYGRIAIVLLTSCGFFLLSLYARSWTEQNIFPILFPAVALSAWVGGRLGGLVSTFLLSLGTAYYHLPPAGFAVGDPDDLVRLGTFTVSGAFVAWLSGALKDSQVIMMATLRGIGDAVIATDRRGFVRFLNPVAEDLTGWSQDDAKGRPLEEVFHSVHKETGAAVRVPPPDMLRGVFTLPENIYLISKSGDQIYIDDSAAPIRIDSGRILGLILVFRDATRRRQNEDALIEAERQRLRAQRMEAIGRLAGGVAHDFNNLLTVISGYADLALKQIDHGSRGRNNIEEIRGAAERAASLTRQLLVFSRGQPVKLEIVNLNEVVANFEKMLRRLISDDIEMVARLANEPIYVQVDVGQIEQVIMNLAVNARDAMPSGGRLTLETRIEIREKDVGGPEAGESAEAYAVLTVADTGIGIDPQAKAHLFEPFFTTKEVGHGTGLGLSIIYGIVKNHYGHLRVSSELGRGSVFDVCLPVSHALPEERLPRSGSPDPPRGTATILLVEDNPDVRKLMREVLTGLGYFVMEAAHAEEAMSVAGNHTETIDLMVSDIVMPGLDGLELAKRIRSIQPHMGVLYVSGYTDHDIVERVLSDPAVAYLKKPFGPIEFACKVAEMISRSRGSGTD